MIMTQFTIDLTDEQISRLKRLHVSNDWELALTEYISDLTQVKAGKPVITNASHFTQRVTAPSQGAHFK